MTSSVPRTAKVRLRLQPARHHAPHSPAGDADGPWEVMAPDRLGDRPIAYIGWMVQLYPLHQPDHRPLRSPFLQQHLVRLAQALVSSVHPVLAAHNVPDPVKAQMCHHDDLITVSLA